MKDLPKVVILLLAGFMAGFGFQSVLTIGFRKARNAEFVAEAASRVGALRAKIQGFKAQKGRYPKDAAEMLAAGFWTADQPPRERLRGGSQWVSAFDGEGGFLYLSATGQLYLNTDLAREKLRSVDREKLKDLVTADALY